MIGGGIAGVSAALAAARHAVRVTLVRRAPGATALTVGGWTGPLPEPLAAAFEAVEHPWVPTTGRGFPSPDGSWRLFDRVADSHTARLSERAIVCGVAGLPGFHAVTLTRMWQEFAGVELSPVTIALSATPPTGWSPVSLAAALDRASADFATRLAAEIRSNDARVAIVPAVLGLDASSAVRQAIESAAGVPVAEALGSAPSIPGWRLERALERLLANAGVNVIKGEVVSATSGTGRVQSVLATTADGDVTLSAGSFVLASGKFIGGGISTNGKLREIALGCPLWIEHAGETFEHGEPLALTNADRREEQPLLAAGVTVNAEGRPIDRANVIVYDNVWAVGTVCRGGEAPAYGLGHAATEGWAAGERATA